MFQHFTRSFWWLGTAIALSSCTDDADVSAPLLNTHWQLTAVGESSVMASSFSFDQQTYVQFIGAGNKIQGLAACDEIGGQFSLNAATKTLRITQITVQPGNCSSPVFGGLYLAALPQIIRFEQDGNTLRLYDATRSIYPRLTLRADN